VIYKDAENFLIDYTANVSVGGMFLESQNPLPVGTRFRLLMEVPGIDVPIETIGEVKWSIPPAESGPMKSGMGIRWDSLKPADLATVSDLLKAWESGDDDVPFSKESTPDKGPPSGGWLS